jgi:YcxB-like protein
MSAIVFSGSVTRENYLRAVRLATGPNRQAKILLALSGAILFTFSVVLPLAYSQDVSSWYPVWGVLVVLAFLFFVVPRIAIDRALKTNKLLQQPFEGTAAEDAIRMTTPNSSVTLPWEVFYQVKEAPKMILLYQGSNLYNLFPREFFANEEDWQTFRSWALAKVPSKAKQRSRIWVFLLWMAIFLVIILCYNFFRSE